MGPESQAGGISVVPDGGGPGSSAQALAVSLPLSFPPWVEQSSAPGHSTQHSGECFLCVAMASWAPANWSTGSRHPHWHCRARSAGLLQGTRGSRGGHKPRSSPAVSGHVTSTYDRSAAGMAVGWWTAPSHRHLRIVRVRQVGKPVLSKACIQLCWVLVAWGLQG